MRLQNDCLTMICVTEGRLLNNILCDSRQCWAGVIFLSMHHTSPCHAVLTTRHESLRCFFLHFCPHHHCFASRVIFFQMCNRKKNCVIKLIRAHTAGGKPHPSPPSSHLPPLLLAVKLSPPHPAVILHPCWWPISPRPRRRETGDKRRETGDGRYRV